MCAGTGTVLLPATATSYCIIPRTVRTVLLLAVVQKYVYGTLPYILIYLYICMMVWDNVASTTV